MNRIIARSGPLLFRSWVRRCPLRSEFSPWSIWRFWLCTTLVNRNCTWQLIKIWLENNNCFIVRATVIWATHYMQRQLETCKNCKKRFKFDDLGKRNYMLVFLMPLILSMLSTGRKSTVSFECKTKEQILELREQLFSNYAEHLQPHACGSISCVLRVWCNFSDRWIFFRGLNLYVGPNRQIVEIVFSRFMCF